MTFDKEEWRNMDTLLDKLVNAPDSIYFIGVGMSELHGRDCAEAQALFYISDSLRRDLKQLQEYLYSGARKGQALEKAQEECDRLDQQAL